jgi:hypothetical protein
MNRAQTILDSVMAVAEGDTVALPYSQARDLYAALMAGDPPPISRHEVSEGLASVTGRKIVLL